jgi:plastocyanin domain-containing protein
MNSRWILAVSLGTLTLASLASSFQERDFGGACCPPFAFQHGSPSKSPAIPVYKGALKATIIVDNGEYSPAIINARKGIPVQLTFKLGPNPGCGIVLVIPGYGIRKELKAGVPNVVTLTPKKPGAIPFTCGMGMLRGKILVT